MRSAPRRDTTTTGTEPAVIMVLILTRPDSRNYPIMVPKKKSPRAAAALDPSFAAIASAFSNDRHVTQGMMMSSYGLKVNGKIFAMYGRSQFVVKLPKQRVDELVSSGTGKRFEPGPGRVMKEWIAFKGEKRNWLGLAQEAYDFVKDGTKK